MIEWGLGMRSGNEVWNAREGQLPVYSEPGLMNNRAFLGIAYMYYKQLFRITIVGCTNVLNKYKLPLYR